MTPRCQIRSRAIPKFIILSSSSPIHHLQFFHPILPSNSSSPSRAKPDLHARGGIQVEDGLLKISRCLVEPTWAWSEVVWRPVQGETAAEAYYQN